MPRLQRLILYNHYIIMIDIMMDYGMIIVINVISLNVKMLLLLNINLIKNAIHMKREGCSSGIGLGPIFIEYFPRFCLGIESPK